MIGKMLAHYEITSLLGKGGMGEVYQAKDQKLGRDVAIKVLPEEFARDADRVARFQREAKLLASLNHPNIAAIHGLEESGGTNFLVLELVEGETLADRVKRGPIPVEESVKLALQIAEALEAAHEKGVIHRDLKPANIKITPEGKVKVLDFGLAKAFAGDQENLNLSNSPTLSNAATMQGVILGTAAYMSPEQARGKEVDKRTDIWAFGCVLYEMLTGQAAFQGEDVTEILASVVKADVKMDLLPANIHPRVREALSRCLQKEKKKRYGDISDAQYEIEKAVADPGGVLIHQGAAAPGMKLRRMLPWIAGLVILAAAVSGTAVWYLRPMPPPEGGPVARFTWELPEGPEFNGDIAISPDGSRFVCGTSAGLYLRSMDSLDARLIPGTDKNSSQPFFSPDGRWIGYYSQSDQKLKKIALGGGAPAVLCNAGRGFFVPASWSSDNTIVYSELPGGEIKRISADGGTPESLIRKDSKETGYFYPQILPDAKAVLFTIAPDQNRANWQIAVQSLETGKREVLVKGGFAARYLPTGQLVYMEHVVDFSDLRNANSINLIAVPFDIDTLKIAGPPVSILQGIADCAVSDSGTLVYYSRLPAATFGSSGNTLVWVNRQGKEEPLDAKPNAYMEPRISPDGTRAALAIETAGNSDIWIRDLVRETMTRLTFDQALESAPVWSPDGQRIAFLSTRDSPVGGIYWKAADGTGDVEPLGSLPDQRLIPWSWSKDGKTIVYMGGGASSDIGMMSMEGDRAKTALLQGKQNEYYPRLSPDGRWLAYQSDESGQEEVYVRSFPDVNKRRWQVSNSGGFGPLWSPGGRELFYWSGNAVVAVAVETEPAFKPGTPRVLFRGSYLVLNMGRQTNLANWDISPDGKRFLMVKPPQSTGQEKAAVAPRQKINIVLNWTEELKQRVPAK